MADSPAAGQFPLLQRLTDLERTPAARCYGDSEYDLSGFRAWMAAIGNPQNRTPWVHIAGTKGKGSTAAMVESILRAAGASTGRVTSPHLEHYGQRFRFSGRPWTLEEFAGALVRFEPMLDGRQAILLDGPHSLRTVFEVLTALAFVEFDDRKTAAGVLEVGMGGRLDCTNIIDPAVAVITPIGIEHTRLLGQTIEEIAGEKAGIIKPGRPVVIFEPISPQQTRAWEIINARAREMEAPILGPLPFEIRDRHANGQVVEIQWRSREINLRLPLLGDHQARNLALALAAVEVFASARGIELTEAILATGAASVHWSGRLEIIPGPPVLVLDGAHCPLSATALGMALNNLAHGPYTLLWGMQRDKDAACFLRELTIHAPTGCIRRVVAYCVPGGRGAEAEDLAEIAREAGLSAETAADPAEAFRRASEFPEALLATGTLYTLAAFAALV